MSRRALCPSLLPASVRLGALGRERGSRLQIVSYLFASQASAVMYCTQRAARCCPAWTRPCSPPPWAPPSSSSSSAPPPAGCCGTARSPLRRPPCSARRAVLSLLLSLLPLPVKFTPALGPLLSLHSYLYSVPHPLQRSAYALASRTLLGSEAPPGDAMGVLLPSPAPKSAPLQAGASAGRASLKDFQRPYLHT